MGFLLSVASIALLVFALIDILTRTDSETRGLPKFGWVILVVLLPLVGSIVWFAVGHEWTRQPRNHGRYVEPSAGSNLHSAPGAGGSDSGDNRVRNTERELADLDREIEYWEAQARLKKAKEAAGEDEAPLGR